MTEQDRLKLEAMLITSSEESYNRIKDLIDRWCYTHDEDFEEICLSVMRDGLSLDEAFEKMDRQPWSKILSRRKPMSENECEATKSNIAEQLVGDALRSFLLDMNKFQLELWVVELCTDFPDTSRNLAHIIRERHLELMKKHRLSN